MKICFIFVKNKTHHTMKGLTKPKVSNKDSNNIRKPEGSPKVILGRGRDLGYISDTLFDKDLQQ